MERNPLRPLLADNDERDRPLTDEIVRPVNSVNLSPAGQAPVRAAKHVMAPLTPAAPRLSARGQLVVGARRTAKAGIKAEKRRAAA